MYEKAFKLEIITPHRVVFKDEATSVSAPGVVGGFQVLYNHAPILAGLEIGELKVKDTSGNDITYATTGGFLEVKDNVVSVLVETAERAGEINVERATAARERARERLHMPQPDIDVERAQRALARALNRLRIASRV